ncbi:MAG: aspartate aminotransferase family protein, partial [Verrucomicrobiota bacterium]|nr:aspartate aminotransferase family protein [Verrucomicrobiota bacterium]
MKAGDPEALLGDLPNEEFRERLHKLADWMADYRERIAERPIAPNAKPGAVLAQLDTAPPETGTSFDEIFADIERVIVPGVA